MGRRLQWKNLVFSLQGIWHCSCCTKKMWWTSSCIWSSHDQGHGPSCWKVLCTTFPTRHVKLMVLFLRCEILAHTLAIWLTMLPLGWVYRLWLWTTEWEMVKVDRYIWTLDVLDVANLAWLFVCPSSVVLCFQAFATFSPWSSFIWTNCTLPSLAVSPRILQPSWVSNTWSSPRWFEVCGVYIQGRMEGWTWLSIDCVDFSVKLFRVRDIRSAGPGAVGRILPDMQHVRETNFFQKKNACALVLYSVDESFVVRILPV